MARGRFLGTWLGLAFVALGPALPSVASAWPEEPENWQGLSFAVRQWTTQDGLPQNTAAHIGQRSNGRLFVATYGGLVSFNGSAFEVEDVSTNPLLASSRFTRLAVGSHDCVYVGTQDGRVFAEHGGLWNELFLDHDCQHETRSIRCAEDGGIWLAKECGLYRGMSGEDQMGLVESGDFHTIGITEELVVRAGGHDRALELRENEVVKRPTIPGLVHLETTTNGRTFGLADGRLHEWTDTGWAAVELDAELSGVQGIRAGKHGRLWLFGSDRLLFFDALADQAVEPEMLAAIDARPRVLDAYEDLQGNLWVGTEAHGLFLFQQTPLRGHPVHMADAVPTAIAHDAQDNVFACADGLLRLEGASLVPVETGAFDVQRIASSRTGGPWLGYPGGIGRLQGAAVVPHWSDAELAPGEPAAGSHAVFEEAQSGALWIAIGGRLMRGTDAGLELLFEYASVVAGEPKSMVELADGSLWVAFERSLLNWNGAEVHVIGEAEGLPDGELRALLEDPAGGVWVASYGGGVCLVEEGRVRVVDKAHGLYENVAMALGFAPSGRMVVLGNRAVTSYDPLALRRVAHGQEPRVYGRVFDRGTGIDILEGSGVHHPRMAQTVDGRLWFPLHGGLASYDEALVTDSPHNIAIETHVDLGEGVHAIANEQRLIDLGDVRDLRVSFAAIDYNVPRQAHYRFRLSPLQKEWQESDSPGTIVYPSLPPGEQRFEIQVALADAPFGPIQVPFEVRAPIQLWERPTVRILTIGLVGAVLMVIVSTRGRAVRRRATLLSKEVEARTEELRTEVEMRREVEAQLRRSGEQLEDMVSQRTAELARALTNLEWDMQRRENIESRLRDSEKLEAVGRLAGGLAHDFNNILTAVMGEADLAQMEIDMTQDLTVIRESLGTHLSNVRSAGLRAARLTRQLLAYSQQQVLQPKRVDPLDIVRDMTQMLERLVPDTCRIEIAEGSHAHPVMIDPGQLEQVVLNLVVNASEAMPNGGRITLGTRIEDTGEGAPVTVLLVSDTGVGLSQGDLAHIFEPFFSTKGKARGLGLASVQGIIVQSGGTLEVESEVGLGTTFRITLPAAAESEAPAAQEAPPAPDRQGEAIRVLLVDDEEDVRRVVGEMLEHLGHEVVQAHDLPSALNALAASAGQFDLLMTDVVMPGGNGTELARQATQRWPEVRVLYITGYSGDPIVELDLIENAQVLSKPFDSRSLQRRIVDLMQVGVLEG